LNGLKAKKHVILCGDLNVSHEEIDIHNPKSNTKSAGFTKEERESFSAFLKTGWDDTFRKLYPTKQEFSYWNYKFNSRAQGKGWRLDYFIVNADCMKDVKDSVINGKIQGSDHCPIELSLQLTKI
jgi:exodeoxyribonuclease III